MPVKRAGPVCCRSRLGDLGPLKLDINTSRITTRPFRCRPRTIAFNNVPFGERCKINFIFNSTYLRPRWLDLNGVFSRKPPPSHPSLFNNIACRTTVEKRTNPRGKMYAHWKTCRQYILMSLPFIACTPRPSFSWSLTESCLIHVFSLIVQTLKSDIN